MAEPNLTSVRPEDCPEPQWHDTHRYCPCCSWTEPESIRREEARKRLGAMPDEALVEIRSDGQAASSNVLVDGKSVYGVQRLELDIDSATGLAHAVLHLDGVLVRWSAEMRKEETPDATT